MEPVVVKPEITYIVLILPASVSHKKNSLINKLKHVLIKIL